MLECGESRWEAVLVDAESKVKSCCARERDGGEEANLLTTCYNQLLKALFKGLSDERVWLLNQRGLTSVIWDGRHQRGDRKQLRKPERVSECSQIY